MDKKKYTYVIVVLTYRDHSDLLELFESLKNKFKDYKIIIVNSYYDEYSETEIRQIAIKNNCDFLSIDNKGYSYGNNKGIEYCKANYNFDFLIVSNPDIIIRKNDLDFDLYKHNEVVFAPQIVTLSKKNQNPYWAINFKAAEFFIYYGYKRKKTLILYCGLALNKIIRVFFLLIIKVFKVNKKSIFAAHGSFIIFSKKALDKINIVYDNNMFLFAEEALLAHKLKYLGINTVFTTDILILHKEDGSVGISNINENNELRKSIIYYYEKMQSKSELI